jgi:hypothetical protein
MPRSAGRLRHLFAEQRISASGASLAGLDPAAARQYLGVREAALYVTKPSRAARDHVTRHQTQYCTPSEKRGDDAERNKCYGAQRE